MAIRTSSSAHNEAVHVEKKVLFLKNEPVASGRRATFSSAQLAFKAESNSLLSSPQNP